MAECGINKFGGGGLDPDELTATASDVLKGKIAGVKDNDEPVEGTLEIQSVVNFKIAQYSNLTLIGTWALPTKGPWSGIRIAYNTGGGVSAASRRRHFILRGQCNICNAILGCWHMVFSGLGLYNYKPRPNLQ